MPALPEERTIETADKLPKFVWMPIAHDHPLFTRICPSCLALKFDDEYYSCVSGVDGKDYYCSDCRRERTAERKAERQRRSAAASCPRPKARKRVPQPPRWLEGPTAIGRFLVG